MPIPSWIIEKIREIERKKKQRDDRPQPQLPIPEEDFPDRPPPEPEDPDKDRGVIIIDPDDAGSTKVGQVIQL